MYYGRRPKSADSLQVTITKTTKPHVALFKFTHGKMLSTLYIIYITMSEIVYYYM